MEAPVEPVQRSPEEEVRRALMSSLAGTLGTLSVDAKSAGYPFLSIAPFALDPTGLPILQLAAIAQHTKNVRADPRASLLVQQPNLEGDPQSGWRITLLGKVETIDSEQTEEMLARFAERVPSARDYERTHAFTLYRLRVERVRYIGGFGRIHWLEADSVLRDPLGAGLAQAAAGAVAHMNQDHADSMVEMCRGLCGFSPARAQMVSIDRAGMLVRAFDPDRLCHFSFPEEIDARGLRQAVIGVLARAREAAKPAAPERSESSRSD